VDYLLICTTALLVSGLTFFTGFGLGTLLLPAFTVFFPVDVAVALTGAVHFLNGLFKLALVGRRADLRVALRFGIPAMVAAYGGARMLVWLSDLSPIVSYRVAGHSFEVLPIKLAVAFLMAAFAVVELVPRLGRISVSPRWLPVGGVLSGFFGGLSGHQGALRSAFLVRAGLSKEAFVATGVVIAALVDVSRLTVYAGRMFATDLERHGPLLIAATASAFAGAWLGNRLLRKVTLRALEVGVATLLFVVAVGLGAGVL